MFITEKFIYIQLQKTGCTHIADLLSQLFEGEQMGSHNAVIKNQNNSIYISSIRNPWDWYLSLWAYGVQGKGGVMSRLTKRNRRKALKQALDESSSKNNTTQERLNKVTLNVSKWLELYEDNSNVASFRKWLKLIHDPKNAGLIGEGYGDKGIAKHCGFMTYRYMKLCCSEFTHLKRCDAVSSYVDLVKFDKKNCYIDYFIRQESLEADLCEVIESVRPINQAERQLIWGAKKTNTSVRPLSISEYYNKESIDLVNRRERLLIEKFGYQFPN
jgi:hypothetical protein